MGNVEQLDDVEKVGSQEHLRNTGPKNKQGTGIQKVWNTVETFPQQGSNNRKEQVFKPSSLKVFTDRKVFHSCQFLADFDKCIAIHGSLERHPNLKHH